MNKLLLLFISPLLLSCTQQHLIVAKNLNQTKIITVDQILTESGLTKPKKKKVTQKKDSTPLQHTKKQKTVKKESLNTATKSLRIPAQEEFSVNLDSRNKFIVLKSMDGGIQFLGNKSNPDKGFFLFKMGMNNALIHFQIYDLSGVLQSRLNYQIIALPALQQEKNTNQDKPLIIDSTKKNNQQIEEQPSGMAETIMRSLEGKRVKEKIKILEDNVESQQISQAERQKLLTRLIQLYIEDYTYKKARGRINQIQDPVTQDYLNALYYHKKKQYNLAMQFYIKTLNKNPDFKQEFLPSMIDLVTTTGNVELSIVQKMEDINKEITDKDAFALNQIGIANIYTLNAEIEKAEKILKNIIGGDYSFSIIQTAEDSLRELKDNFLDYR